MKFLYGNKPDFDINDPKQIIDELMSICTKHLNEKTQAESKEEKRKYEQKHESYRIFFYDCSPIVKKAHYPVSNKAPDFAKTPQTSLRQAIHGELKKRRKTALRLGKLGGFGRWRMKSDILKDILNKNKKPEDLKDDDFYYDIRQKGVDMRIGIDIASVAYKKQAERIVLI